MNKEIKLPPPILPPSAKIVNGKAMVPLSEHDDMMLEYAKQAVELNRQQVEPTEADMLIELNHTQYLMLANCRALAARHRKEDWAQHILRFCDEAIVHAVHFRQCKGIVEQPASDDSQHLNNLLARIHRDGGHYQGQHGTDKAVVDADLIVARLYASDDKPVAWMYDFLSDGETIKDWVTQDEDGAM